MQWVLENYQWVKAVHIIGVICWMAGLFYLPRLFVYHSEHNKNMEFVTIVRLQEYRLFTYIMRPAMLISIITGLCMIVSNIGLFKTGMWIHIKLLFAFLLFIYHIVCGILVKKMKGECGISGRFFRVFNEIPTVLMIVIVLCAVVKF